MRWFRGILWLGSDIASSAALHIFHYRLLFPALPRKSGQHQPSPNQLTSLRLIITTRFCWNNELMHSEGRQSLTAALFIHYLSPIPASKLSAHRFSVHRQSPFSPAAFSGGCRLLCNPSAARTSASTAQGTGGTSGTPRHEITGLLSGTLTLPPVSLLPPPCPAISDPTPGEALV